MQEGVAAAEEKGSPVLLSWETVRGPRRPCYVTRAVRQMLVFSPSLPLPLPPPPPLFMVAHVLNLSTKGAEARWSLCVWGQPGLHIELEDTLSQKRQGSHVAQASLSLFSKGWPWTYDPPVLSPKCMPHSSCVELTNVFMCSCTSFSFLFFFLSWDKILLGRLGDLSWSWC